MAVKRFARIPPALWMLCVIVNLISSLRLISLPTVLQDLSSVLIGIGLVAFSILNAQFEVARRMVKRIRVLGGLADTKVARVYYGTVLSVFALVVGLAWTFFPLTSLIQDFRR